MRRDTDTPRQLTPREREVLALLSRGHANAAIASRLVISQNTLEHHLTSLYAKLGVTSRSQAILHAFRHQLLDPSPSPSAHPPQNMADSRHCDPSQLDRS